MEKQKKDMFVKVTTPPGIAKFPYIRVPNEFKGKKNFKTGLILDKNAPEVSDLLAFLMKHARVEHERVLAELNQKFKTEKGKAKADARSAYEKLKDQAPFIPVRPCYDEDGNETDRIELTAKSPTNKKDGTPIRIHVFDAKGKAISADPWGGSIIRVSGFLLPFYTEVAGAGVTLRLQAVKVLKLVTKGQGGDASMYGFGGEEDGYSEDEDGDHEASALDGEDAGGGEGDHPTNY